MSILSEFPQAKWISCREISDNFDSTIHVLIGSWIYFNFFFYLRVGDTVEKEGSGETCFNILRRLESFGTKSLDVRNTFFRHCLVNT